MLVLLVLGTLLGTLVLWMWGQVRGLRTGKQWERTWLTKTQRARKPPRLEKVLPVARPTLLVDWGLSLLALSLLPSAQAPHTRKMMRMVQGLRKCCDPYLSSMLRLAK